MIVIEELHAESERVILGDESQHTSRHRKRRALGRTSHNQYSFLLIDFEFNIIIRLEWILRIQYHAGRYHDVLRVRLRVLRYSALGFENHQYPR